MTKDTINTQSNDTDTNAHDLTNTIIHSIVKAMRLTIAKNGKGLVCNATLSKTTSCPRKCMLIDSKHHVYAHKCDRHGALSQRDEYFEQVAKARTSMDSTNLGMGEPGASIDVPYLPPSIGGDTNSGGPSTGGAYLSKEYILENLKQIDEILKIAYEKAKGGKGNNKDLETYIKVQDKAAKFRDMLQDVEKNSVDQVKKRYEAEIGLWTRTVSEIVGDEMWNKIVTEFKKRLGK